MKVHKQISIRSLLLLTTLVAVMIVVWSFRPQPRIVLDFGPNGIVRVNGVTTHADNIVTEINNQRRWRSVCFQASHVVVLLPTAFFQTSTGYLSEEDSSFTNCFNQKNSQVANTTPRYSIRLSRLEEFLTEYDLHNVENLTIGGVSSGSGNLIIGDAR